MIKYPTVFILGAGASEPYNFPLGRDLLELVYKKLGQPEFCQKISTITGASKDFLSEFREHLIKSGRSSVDAFLEHRHKFLEVGKIAIAMTLIPREEPGLVEIANKKTNDWYRYLYRELSSSFEDLDKNKVSFITFNYDRSLEYYLLQTTIHAYEVSRTEAIEKLKKIPIIHLHGQLGKLTGFQNEIEYERPYNPDVTLDDVKFCADNIHIIHESDETSPEFERAHEIIENAKIRCFLGFGYHENNVKRLIKPMIKKAATESRWLRFMGSAYGVADGERKRIEGMFKLSPSQRAQRISLGDKKHDALDFIRNNEVFL